MVVVGENWFVRAVRRRRVIRSFVVKLWFLLTYLQKCQTDVVQKQVISSKGLMFLQSDLIRAQKIEIKHFWLIILPIANGYFLIKRVPMPAPQLWQITFVITTGFKSCSNFLLCTSKRNIYCVKIKESVKACQLMTLRHISLFSQISKNQHKGEYLQMCG